MKKNVIRFSIVLAAMIFTFVSIGYAKDPVAEKSEKIKIEAEPAAPESIILAGTINDTNQLVVDQGETFNLSGSFEGMKTQSFVGKKIEVKGTVMEKEGQKIVEVEEYKIIE